MKARIWRFLSQILFYRRDLAEIIKPFMQNLNNENIDDEKYIPFLKMFPKDQLKVLCQNEIINAEKLNSLITNSKKSSSDNSNIGTYNTRIQQIERIISGDKIKELEELIRNKDINTFNTITNSFNEVEEMNIPLIQYCVMKNAINCFKFLLVNGFDDPNNIMEEQTPSPNNRLWINEHRYEWGCMATAIYFGSSKPFTNKYLKQFIAFFKIQY